METSNLRLIMKNKLLDSMIRQVQPEARWKILILDPLTMKLLTSVLTTFEVLEENVTSIELITKKRQPQRSQDAIYFLSPTTESVHLFIQEFPGKGWHPMYRNAHMFFSGALSQKLFDSITASSAGKHIKRFTELNLDFNAVESQVYTVDSPLSFYRLYSPSVSTSTVEQQIDRMASKILSLVTTLGEFPYIRYYDSPPPCKSPMLAQELQRQMDLLSRSDESFAALRSKEDRATLIVLDRSFDVTSPMIHEFTYQALVNDLISLEENTYKYQSGDTGETRETVLDEEDHLWLSLRHRHIAECIDEITKSFKKLTENKAASHEAGEKTTNLENLRDVVTSLPQYLKDKELHGAHINLAQECLALYTKLKLAEIAAVEQDMATGQTSDGRAAKSVLGDMVPLLDDEEISMTAKARMLITYFVSREGVLEEDRKKLVLHSKIPRPLELSILNLSLLGVNVTREGKTKKHPKKKKEIVQGDFELSRYVTELKTLINEYYDGKLGTKQIPYLGEAPAQGASLSTRQPASLRGTKPSWHKKEMVSAAPAQRKGPKLIVFIIGGMTFSEIRNVYEATEQHSRDVYLGSTHTIIPDRFLQHLSSLSDKDINAWQDVTYGFNTYESPIMELTRPKPPSGAGGGKVPSKQVAPVPAKPKSPATPSKDEKKKKKKWFGS